MNFGDMKLTKEQMEKTNVPYTEEEQNNLDKNDYIKTTILEIKKLKSEGEPDESILKKYPEFHKKYPKLINLCLCGKMDMNIFHQMLNIREDLFNDKTKLETDTKVGTLLVKEFIPNAKLN